MVRAAVGHFRWLRWVWMLWMADMCGAFAQGGLRRRWHWHRHSLASGARRRCAAFARIALWRTLDAARTIAIIGYKGRGGKSGAARRFLERSGFQVLFGVGWRGILPKWKSSEQNPIFAAGRCAAPTD